MLRSPLLSLAFLLLLAPAALADLAEVTACADKTDDKERLACYDAAVAKLKTDMANAEVREKEKGKTLFGLPIPFTGPKTEEDFGKPPTEPPEQKEVTEISAKVTGFSRDALGHIFLMLDNGQVWRVDEYRPVLLSTAGTTTVSIERRFMGGYYMSVNGADSNLTVTRIK